MKTWLAYCLYFGGLLLYSAYSFLLVDPNLILSSQPLYWSLQNYLWQWVADNNLSFAILYGVIIGVTFVGFLGILNQLRTSKASVKQVWQLLLLAIGCLLIAYPALSHDVFNYMFNAKMVWVYQTNPHTHVALEFANDPWLLFMHNTHTVAPYGYGWTALSLLPSILGQNHVKTTLIAFRLMMTGSLLLLFWLQNRLLQSKFPSIDNAKTAYQRVASWFKHRAHFLTGKQEIAANSANEAIGWRLALFFLNPLVLIETVGNIHNDVVMMALAFLAVYCLCVWQKSSKSWFVWLALLFFMVSVSVKFATLTMLGGLIMVFLLAKRQQRLGVADVMAVSLFLPLLTARSQRFLPWYLIWPLAWAPFASKKLQKTFLIFSLSALLGYLPYLYFGQYNEGVLFMRLLVTFTPPLVYLAIKTSYDYFRGDF